MDFRTDLALERCEFLGKKNIEGVRMKTTSSENAKITRISIENSKGADALGKPVGNYTTVEVKPFAGRSFFIDESFVALKKEIAAIIPQKGSVLVAGLGNLKITPDSLGPKCASMIFATRHITGELLKVTGFSNLRSVTAFSTGVLGETGAESAEVIKGIANVVKPDFIITVDALAARSTERLGTTVQMCNTGIVPGSGVGNSRQMINETTVGVPVISIGVPTVVDAATLIYDYAGIDVERKELPEKAKAMMVTPREVDLMIERAAKLTSLAINCALQSEISPEDMLALTS